MKARDETLRKVKNVGYDAANNLRVKQTHDPTPGVGKKVSKWHHDARSLTAGVLTFVQRWPATVRQY